MTQDTGIPKEYFYSEEEVSELTKRAATDHISMVALNNYTLSHSNILSELYETLMVKIKTEIVEPVKAGDFKLKQDDGTIDSLMALFDKIPKIVDGMSKLKMEKGAGYTKEPEDKSLISSIGIPSK